MGNIIQCNAAECDTLLEDNSVDIIITSPPYYDLRDYNNDKSVWNEVNYIPILGGNEYNVKKQETTLGNESDYMDYIGHLVFIFRILKDKLKDTGCMFVNIGDTYASNWACNRNNGSHKEACAYDKRKNRLIHGVKDRELLGIPWRFAFAMQADGWYLRQEIVWDKTIPTSEKSQSRFKRQFETIFMFTKISKGYKFFSGTKNFENNSNVWKIPIRRYIKTNSASYPEALVAQCIRAIDPDKNAVILDPFLGTGTTGIVAEKLGFKNWIGFEMNECSIKLAKLLIQKEVGQLI